MGLGEMKCDIAGFELLSHPRETKCFSHWVSFQRISWWYWASSPFLLFLKRRQWDKWFVWGFSPLLLRGEAGTVYFISKKILKKLTSRAKLECWPFVVAQQSMVGSRPGATLWTNLSYWWQRVWKACALMSGERICHLCGAIMWKE